MDNIIKLEKPISFGSKELTELTFNEPTGREMSLIKDSMSFGDVLKIASLLVGEPIRALEKLGVRDCRKVVEHTSFLLGGGD